MSPPHTHMHTCLPEGQEFWHILCGDILWQSLHAWWNANRPAVALSWTPPPFLNLVKKYGLLCADCRQVVPEHVIQKFVWETDRPATRCICFRCVGSSDNAHTLCGDAFKIHTHCQDVVFACFANRWLSTRIHPNLWVQGPCLLFRGFPFQIFSFLLAELTDFLWPVYADRSRPLCLNTGRWFSSAVASAMYG